MAERAGQGQGDDAVQSAQHVRWWCDDCGTNGVIEHDADASVYEVVEALRDGHGRASGGRHLDIAHVHVEGHIGV